MGQRVWWSAEKAHGRKGWTDNWFGRKTAQFKDFALGQSKTETKDKGRQRFSSEIDQ